MSASTNNFFSTTAAPLATASPSASATPAPFAALRFDHGGFVYNADLVILAVLAVFVLFALPQAFTRFTHGPEWFQGLFLRSVEIAPPVQLQKQASISTPSRAYFSPTTPNTGRTEFYTDKEYENSDEGHSPRTNLHRNKSSGSAHVNLLRNTSTSSGRVRRTHVNLPSHMPGWSSILPWASQYLQISIRPGVTVGKALIVLAYTIAIIYAGLYRSNPFTQSIRTGWLAISQIPVVIVLATKNNVPGMLLGISYERVRLQFLPFDPSLAPPSDA